jgi:hypothetical protein
VSAASNDIAASVLVLDCPVRVGRNETKRSFMMGNMGGWIHGGWMAGGMWVWPLLIVLVVVIVLIIKVSKR